MPPSRFFDQKVDRSLRRVVLGRGRGVDVTLPARGRVVATSELLVEGVHFDLAYMTPRELAWKALAVVLSDVAAMGAAPQFAQVTLGARQETAEPFLQEFQAGLQVLARRYGLGLGFGPRTDAPQALLVHITALAQLHGSLVGYDGARAGDAIVVTGSLGGSAAGLNCLKRLGRHALRDKEPLLRAHLLPEPRIAEAKLLCEVAEPTAMVDLCDGLASELHLLAGRSGVGALVDQAALPLSAPTQQAAELINSNAMAWALYGAEDFELLATIPAKHLEKARRAFAKKKRPLTVIGAVRPAKAGVLMRDLDGELVSLQPKLWHNFVRRRRLATE